MLKYRPLTPDELAELEPEFKQFLIVNELYDAEWRALANSNPKKAQAFIDLFSNIVLEKAYSDMTALLQVGKDFIAIFNFQDDPWHFYHFQVQTALELKQISPGNLLEFLRNNFQSFDIRQGKKKSSEQKAFEVHQLINKGAQPIQKELIQEILQFIQHA